MDSVSLPVKPVFSSGVSGGRDRLLRSSYSSGLAHNQMHRSLPILFSLNDYLGRGEEGLVFFLAAPKTVEKSASRASNGSFSNRDNKVCVLGSKSVSNCFKSGNASDSIRVMM